MDGEFKFEVEDILVLREIFVGYKFNMRCSSILEDYYMKIELK